MQPSTRFLILFGVFLALGLPAGVSPAGAQTLQERIDLAQPGDTVWVAPGQYRRAVSVDKEIVIKGEGDGVELVGIRGSLASIEDLAFDGSLDMVEDPLVEADSDLEFLRCRFVNAVRGVLVNDGASGVRIVDCVFEGTLQGVSLASSAQSVYLEGTTFQECLVAVNGESGFVCNAGPERQPAQRCETGCGEVSLIDVVIQGGENQIEVNGDYRLIITDCEILGGINCVTGTGIRLEMTNTKLSPGSEGGTGIDLQVASGFVRGCEISGWNIAVRIGDGGCPLYSDLVLGGSLADANNISGSTGSLVVEQPEALDADYNFWGTTLCSAVLSSISGQTVAWITDAGHMNAIPCGGTPVEPTRWGSIKSRYLDPGSDRDR